MPQLKGKLDGFALRVPTQMYLLQILFANLKNQLLKKKSTKHSRKAAAGELKGILGVSDVPLVSCDFSSDPRSSIVDADLTMVMDNNMVKVVSWYDNEWGYSNVLSIGSIRSKQRLIIWEALMKQTIEGLQVDNKTVFVRVDFNVPMKRRCHH